MAVENTALNPRPEWTLGGNPTAIENQERRGQAQLSKSSQLPCDGLDATAAALGIEIVGPSNGDALFADVRLPNGWRIQPTTHDMWSDLLDADGTKRASIFYKAAFYDRRAFISLEKA